MFVFLSCVVLHNCSRDVTVRSSRRPEQEFAKADSTLRSSQAVPHPSTNRALRRLTSEVERDPVYSTRYGRQRECMTQRPQCTLARTSVRGRCHQCIRIECNRMGWNATKWNKTKMCTKRVELCTFYSAEVTALHSGLVSHHCK